MARTIRCSRTPRDVDAAAHGLEGLEPRVLLAAYTGQSLADLFNLPTVLHDLVQPPGVVEVGGFGLEAAGVGDVDGDGFGDIAVSAPGNGPGLNVPIVPGHVFIFSGATGEVIRMLSDGFGGFGVSIANVGDIDGDGRPDLLVGSPRADLDRDAIDDPTGAAYIYSGADGEMIRSYVGTEALGEFGRAVALQGAPFESFTQVLVGAPGAGLDGQGPGQVFVISTAEVLDPMPGSEVVLTLTGEGAGDRFGSSLAGVGDADAGDPPLPGEAEILVGAPLNDGAGVDAGRAYLFDGTTGALRLTLSGELPGDRFGTSVNGGRAGQRTVLMAGAPGWDFVYDLPGPAPIPDVGRVYGYDAGGEFLGGTLVQGADENGRLGELITRVGDITGDGVMDFALHAPGSTGLGRIEFTSGPGGFRFAVAGSLPEGRRERAFAAGDVDGDGVADMLAAGGGSAGGVTVLSAHAVLRPSTIFGGNENLTFLFASSVGNLIGATADYAFIDGVFTYQSQIPGVGHGAVIKGVNNAGVIVGRLFEVNEFGVATETVPFFVVDGVRTLLHEAVVEVVGREPPPANRLSPVKIGNDGTILLNEVNEFGSAQWAWMFKDGVLTFLWEGSAADVNDNGVVVGSRNEPGTNMWTGVLRGTDGVVTVLDGVRFAGAINNEGAVAGSSELNRLVVWRAGEVTEIPLPPAFLQPQPQFSATWVIQDIADDGRIAATYHQTIGRGTSRTVFLFTPGDGLEVLQDILFGGLGGVGGAPILFADDGRILTGTAVLTPIDEAVAWGIAPGSFLTSAASLTQTVVVGKNTLGDTILLQQVAGETAWRGRRLGEFTGAITDAIAYTDARNEQVYLFVITEGAVWWGLVGSDARWGGFALNNAPESLPIADHAAVFFTSDGRGVLVGTEADGDVIMYFQPPGEASPSVWIPINLTASHIEAGGQEMVAVASDLTGFATPWGTDHIAYLDAQGRVQVLWWAPGTTLWRADQLTTAEGSGGGGFLFGTPTSFVTPWSTLHINAFDADGRVVAVWWAPGFGARWRTDPLAPEGAELVPNAVASFVTPWNALNIVGLDVETGEVTVYWWAPETGEWRVERVEAAGAPEGFEPAPPLSAGVSPAGEQNIFVRSEGDAIARLFWTAGGGWRYESVTAGAAG